MYLEEGALIEEIFLNFNKSTGRYLVNKSIHETRKHKWLDKYTLELKFKVFNNYELERLIMSYGESAKIIEPRHLTEKIKERLLKVFENY